MPIREYQPDKTLIKMSRLAREAKISYEKLSEREPESFDPVLLRGEAALRINSHSQFTAAYNQLTPPNKIIMKQDFETFLRYNRRLIGILEFAAGEEEK